MRATPLLTGMALLAAPTLAHAQARTAQTVLMSEDEGGRAAQERYGYGYGYGYSDAVIAGDTVYLSGIVVGRAPGDTNMEPGFERAFRHIERILTRAGSSLAEIVDMTSFHTELVGQVEAMSAVQRRLLGSPPPAWTAVQVTRLLPDGGLAEIKIIARRSAAAAR